MSPFLFAVVGVLATLFMTLIDPAPRNVRALKAGAVALLVGGLAAWLWPLHAAQLLGVVLILAILWLLAHALFWPVRFIGDLLRGQ